MWLILVASDSTEVQTLASIGIYSLRVSGSIVCCSQRAPVLLSTLQYCVSVVTLSNEKPKLSHTFLCICCVVLHTHVYIHR